MIAGFFNMKTINNIDELLALIVTNKDHNAKFLNTLSLMELCGAKKLADNSKYFGFDNFFLEHIAEEFRHAFFLRHLAQKISKVLINNYDDTQLFCAKESRSYIHSIDRAVCVALRLYKNDIKIYRLAYFLTTLVIERRAMSFYKLYQQVLDDYKVGISVRSIISEEEDHLSYMENEIKILSLPNKIIDKAIFAEEKFFTIWFNALIVSLT